MEDMSMANYTSSITNASPYNLCKNEINETAHISPRCQSSYLSNGDEGDDWGPKRDSLYIVISITLLYAFIFVTGIVGNICTCVVISRNKSMHTATNYYLFSLAVSDLLLLISGLPTEIYSTWSKYPYIFGEAFCIMQGFAAETSANATVLTITAFTIERYMAICHPFLSHTMSKLSRAVKFVIGIWMVAMCLALPQAMSLGIVYHTAGNKDDHYVCNVKRIIIPHAFEISTFLFFITPMTVITILYILIGLQIRKSTQSNASNGSIKMEHRKCNTTYIHHNGRHKTVLGMRGRNDNVRLTHDNDGRKNYARNAQASKHVVKMLVAVVVAFFICWAPFHAQRLLAIYAQPDSANMITIFNILTYISGILYYLSTTVNPCLYHIMSRKFRLAFKDTMLRLLGKRRRKPGEKCYVALSGRSNTDSVSQQSSLRYLETEMRRLQESRRPLVVSFRRRKPISDHRRTQKVTLLDVELQKALDTLNQESNRMQSESLERISSQVSYEQRGKASNCEILELPVLAFSVTNPEIHQRNCYRDSILDIEVFREQQIRLSTIQRTYHQFEEDFNDFNRDMVKSCTMPNMSDPE